MISPPLEMCIIKVYMVIECHGSGQLGMYLASFNRIFGFILPLGFVPVLKVILSDSAPNVKQRHAFRSVGLPVYSTEIVTCCSTLWSPLACECLL